MMQSDALNVSVNRCPDVILGEYNVTLPSCPGGAELDVCTDKKRLDFNYTQCGAGQYSGEVVYNCLYNTDSGDMTYLTLYNDAEDDGSNPFIPFSCVVMATSSGGVNMTHAPGDCKSGQTSTEVTDPGISKQLSLVSTCETPTTTPAPTTSTAAPATTDKNSATTRFMSAWIFLVTLTLIGCRL
ncbi:uncharacterized protein LOC124281434 isoform X2 [Haliotis rubra]|uniref:uncharacterized protein LOC124281434 isoform X2 n=1 Tax=Haliotis rubra TaxID=36100 RepID=UPI001EE59618|nr:uncharacterized protein LOC124281434 isoform X2 [Haliotis rubra]